MSICSNLSTKRNRKRSPNAEARLLSKLIALFTFAFIAQAAAAPTDQLMPSGVFGSLEIQTNASQGTAQWRKAQVQLQREHKTYAACDQGAVTCPKHLRDWRARLQDWKRIDLLSQIQNVNAYVNTRIQWVDDKQSTGKRDLWSTPLVSFKGKGDCEDFAIAKYESLKALGFPENSLRIVVLNDTRKNIGHAVLSVNTSAGLYILDNQNDRAFLHSSVAYYAPIYSVNAEGRWMNLAVKRVESDPIQVASLELRPSVFEVSDLTTYDLGIPNYAKQFIQEQVEDLRPSLAALEFETQKGDREGV